MMDSFPVGTSTAACSLPFVAHGSVVAGRVFAVPFEVVCDQVECLGQVPFRCLDHSNAKVEVSVPMELFVVMMEDLNLK